MELQRAGKAGVLLGPEFFQQLGDPAVDRSPSLQAGVAGQAEGDQGRGAVGGGAVVDDERRGGLADAEQVAVARQYPFPGPAEAGPRAPAAVVANLAQVAAVELPGAAGAAKRDLFLESEVTAEWPGRLWVSPVTRDIKRVEACAVTGRSSRSICQTSEPGPKRDSLHRDFGADLTLFHIWNIKTDELGC